MDAVSVVAATRVCGKCRQELPATTEFFSPRHDRPVGLNAWCKACHAVYAHASYVANLEARREQNRQYRLEHREERAAAARAWREANREHVEEYSKAVKERVNATSRAWQEAHPEERAAAARNYRARKNQNGGTHTAADVRRQLKQQRGKCFWCKTKVNDKYHVDHVVPLSKGGSNGPENLVVACPGCNMSKGHRHPMDFAGVML